MKYHFLLAILGLLLISSSLSLVRADDHVFGEEEDDDVAEGLGSIAVGLLVVGFSYVALRRLYVYSRTWSDEQKERKDMVMAAYRKARKPLLIIHNLTLGFSTIVAAVHGYLFLHEDLSDIIIGTIAWVIMVVLSLFGLIMYYRVRPVWDNRDVKGFVRFVHRQWILSVVLIILLLIHAG